MTSKAPETTISWKLTSGQTITATVAMRDSVRHLGTNEWTGEDVTRNEGLAIEVTVEAMGRTHRGWGPLRHRAMNAKGYTHCIGQVAVPAATAREIEAAIAHLEASPEWQEQEERRAAHQAELDRCDAERRAIERAMSL